MNYVVKFNGHNNKLYTYINAACTITTIYIKILLPEFWLPISSNEFKTYKKGIDTCHAYKLSKSKVMTDLDNSRSVQM